MRQCHGLQQCPSFMWAETLHICGGPCAVVAALTVRQRPNNSSLAHIILLIHFDGAFGGTWDATLGGSSHRIVQHRFQYQRTTGDSTHVTAQCFPKSVVKDRAVLGVWQGACTAQGGSNAPPGGARLLMWTITWLQKRRYPTHAHHLTYAAVVHEGCVSYRGWKSTTAGANCQVMTEHLIIR